MNWGEKRKEMVRVIRNAYGLKDERVLQVMQEVPREKFAPKKFIDSAYNDNPISIGCGQTMSQPYTVAKMTSLILANSKLKTQNLKKKTKVLEIGTGSGYQAAILSYFFDEVYSVEVVAELARSAKKRIEDLGFKNVNIKEGNGIYGWRKHAPYDAIIITAALEKEIPQEIVNQLKVCGVLVAPIGHRSSQTMTRFTKIKGLKYKDLKNATSLKLRGAWEEFDRFVFVPFVESGS